MILALSLDDFSEDWSTTEEDGDLAAVLPGEIGEYLVPVRSASLSTRHQPRYGVSLLLLVDEIQGHMETNSLLMT